MSTLVVIHICGAVIGLLSGTLAMIFRKGSSLHRLAGNIFVISMIVMASSAAYIAQFLHPIRINVIAALLTLYLVVTGWWWGRRRVVRPNIFDVVAFFFIVFVTGTAM